jgi:hypothetical protein
MRDEELTPEIRSFLATILPRFAAEGFQTAANIGMTDPPKRAWAVQALLVNRDTNDVAVAIVAAARSKASVAVAVRSEFADGTQVVTGAKRGDPSLLPRNPAIDSLGFSWVRDPRVLCEVHRRRLARLGFTNRPRAAPPPGAELPYMEAERERDFAFWEHTGYYYRYDAGGAMRLT